MPTYQYRCDDCQHEFEKFQPITEDPITVCPACKGHTRRVISGGAGLLFKGSGFYITDYRSAAYKSQASKESSSSTTSDSSSSSKPKETKSDSSKPKSD